MATILLQAAGSAIGGMLGPLGGILGGAAGALAGRAIDQAIFGQNTVTTPGLEGARIASPDEGSPISRIYGTMRVAGNLFWATRFEEEITTERQGGKASSGTSVETRNYYANFALGLCEGEISQVKRIWADGKELDLSQIDIRIYKGSIDQLPDPLIEAKQGADNTPAYRGLAYIVFDHFPIDAYGNRIPILHFEVTKVISELENKIQAVTLIPGATEHGLANVQISETPSSGEQNILNHHVSFATTDLEASLDELQSLCPNLKSIGLVVSWFGTDLRADYCTFVPKVEVRSRSGESRIWSVGSTTRETAALVSSTDDILNFGGTPDDQSIIDAIMAIKSRGLNLTLYPFILMDIPSDNNLTSPYGDETQSAFPWRGRITCNPAIGETGTADQTAAATAQISTLIGSSTVTDFLINGTSVSCTTSDNGYRHMLLHYAHLAKASADNGYSIDGFVIGSEMVALTRVRDHQNTFPFVTALCELADDIYGLIGDNTKLTYAADWSEYFGYHPQDGSNDVYFHLDELWAHSAIHAVGIDNYMPLSDWRDQDVLAENLDGFRLQNDDDALKSQINSGEGYDYFYQSSDDRKERLRTSITDGLDKPWVFRYKDIKAWWENTHYNRVNGVELSTPTSWIPQSKPVWFTEFGCPAVDKGANQPNVFPDPKSSEAASPYYSSNARDDQAQRSYLSAHLNFWASDENPLGMVDLENSYIWTWDARPFPAFPANTSVWSDGENWRQGHWINGRLGNAPLRELVSAILIDHGFEDFDVSLIEGTLQGFVQSDFTSARSLLDGLLKLFLIDVREGEDKLIFSSRVKTSKSPVMLDRVIDQSGEPLMRHSRGQESELANEVQITHIAPMQDYQPATAYSRRLSRGSQRQENLTLPGAIDQDTAANLADQWLQNHWASRETIDFSLPLDAVALEVGDRIEFDQDTTFNAPPGSYSIVQIEDGLQRQITANRLVASTNLIQETDEQSTQILDVSAGFNPNVIMLDLPLLSGTSASEWARAAAYAKPWVPIILSSSTGDDGFEQRANITVPAYIGTLSQDLVAGPEGRFDYANQIIVDLPYGEFETIDASKLLAGGNVLAIQSQNQAWEIVQFQTALEIASNQWQLSSLLRAQSGTEDAMLSGAIAGADVVLINDNVISLGLNSSELEAELNWQITGVGKSSEHLENIAFSGGARAHTPLSPVHLRGQRISTGIQISWIRRGRLSADNWSGTEILEDEDQLQYLISIYDDEEIIHQAISDTSSYLYEDAQQFIDFGEYPSSLTFSVQQIGGQIAQGIARKVSIFV
ncbi:MAG: glycoside hydrolase/phage tail family protein [Lentilitoribacter sp.]